MARTTLEVHFKLFGTDGVSLQSQELADELTRVGWRVHRCASDVPPGVDGLRIPELSYQSADAAALRKRVFAPGTMAPDEQAALMEELASRAAAIQGQVEQYLDAHGVTVVHVRNLMSLPYNLPASIAFHAIAVSRPNLGFLMQHHDLYWEGPNARIFDTDNPAVRELLERVMCPDLPNARHVLINPIAQEALRERTGIEGTCVPDGFNFDRPVTAIDERVFRERLAVLVGDQRPIADDDVVVAMPARVAINKAIELAVQFVAALDERRGELERAPDGVGRGRRRLTKDSRVVLLLPQGEDLEDNREYFDRVVAYARSMGITVAYGGDIVVPDRRYAGDDAHYPFYSTYQAVDMVCYPPEHEGFGNQAIETVWARLPLAVLEYAVFERYVKQHVPHFISLGDTSELLRLDDFGGLHQLRPDVLAAAADRAVRVLTDHDLEREWTDGNYAELRAFCGIDVVAAEYVRLYGELEATATRPPR